MRTVSFELYGSSGGERVQVDFPDAQLQLSSMPTTWTEYAFETKHITGFSLQFFNNATNNNVYFRKLKIDGNLANVDIQPDGDHGLDSSRLKMVQQGVLAWDNVYIFTTSSWI